MSESVFNGWLLPVGKGGQFEHVASPWIHRYEKGGVFLLDEMDAGDPNLFTYVNKAIANKSYTVAQRYTKPVVKKHDDFVLVAAANTFGNGADAMYVGRNQLDAATLDRFKVGMITMDYNRDVEASIASPELCEWAWGVRDRIYRQRVRRIMSTRVIKDLAVMTEMYGWTKADWAGAFFKGWASEERKLVEA
jgi:cobaltochelatase CobS